MKKIIFALLTAFAFAPAWADQDPNVAAAQSANNTIAQCMTAVTSGAAGMAPEAKALLVTQAPRMCREAVVMPVIKQGPTTGQMIWDATKFGLQLWAGYKNQALVWGAVTGVVDRLADSTDAAVQQGFGVANTAISQPPYILAPTAAGEFNLVSPQFGQ